MKFSWKAYDPGSFYDELISSPGRYRPAGRAVARHIRSLTTEEIRERQMAAELAVKTMGITFTVYAQGTNIDRAWPYDIIPRTISGSEWDRVEAGLTQRLTALNHFINDVYNDQKVFRDGIVPRELILESSNYRAACLGMKPKFGVWAHICGSDLIRDRDGTFYVLEDNLRVPSGVSYMLENRKVTKRVFPELFESQNMRPIGEYTSALFDTLASLSPRRGAYPEVVVLTPGIFNSAYFEHSYLAQQMGAELVEGPDLFVGDDDCVYMRTISGPERVDVIYRRIDDLFLDPEVFNADSALGVPGLMRAWLKGKVALANAPGAGVADDKAVYTYVPDLIRYYLGEEPIIPNVQTWRCSEKAARRYVLENLDSLVVKPANESGGYGMLIGPAASERERRAFARRIRANPRNYVAQPLISLSTCPTVCPGGIEPRHIDLRPFVLQGARHYVTPGGLTRVALVKGSYVVNSSQGGGSKDTWIVD
ncbi:MAG: circularly permuted type 2 ATP-grasp protein [Gammaproteobacteria bacterium]|nr:circularly permuted type 2 ATP-grasp protein [Gammaproteobacteria bacterium]MCP5201012.1 circularly permuted type 2 ATP-grasp protein [Gammaproteobacteria bacterium]